MSRKRKVVAVPSVVLSELPVFEMGAVTGAAALDFFRRHQILHVRPSTTTTRGGRRSGGQQQLKALYQRPGFAEVFGQRWSVENAGAHKSADLTPAQVLGGDHVNNSPFYVSTVLQQSVTVLDAFLHDVPVAVPSIFEDSAWQGLVHTAPVWLFYGANPSDQPFSGRPLHTDSVSHSGTWHCQWSGAKTWHVRPLAEADEWSGSAPEISAGAGGNGGARKQRTSRAAPPLLRIECQRGDLLLINTRLWWHHTTLPPQGTELSISYARDFYCANAAVPGSSPPVAAVNDAEAQDFDNVEELYASKNVKKGAIVLTESELPDCALPRSCVYYLWG
jgi:hypothetical protein